MSKKYSHIINLRVLATFAVILIHVSMDVRNSNLTIDLIYGGLSRFCVPIFLMISGALLLGKDISLKDFISKRFKRILIPFLFWSILYIIFKLAQLKQSGENINPSFIINFFINQFLTLPSYHLWYIYMLLGILMILPIINRWIITAPLKEIKYFIGLWLIVQCIQFLFKFELSQESLGLYFSGYLGYLILGYYLNLETTKISKYLSILCLVCGYLITVLGTQYLYNRDGKFLHDFYSYLSPNVIIFSVGIFSLFKNSEFKSPTFFEKIVNEISNASFGIYLIHWLIMVVLRKMHLDYQFINPYLAIPLVTILIITISYILINILDKLPFGSHISGK